MIDSATPKKSTEPPLRELAFTRTNGPVDTAIENLMAMAGGIARPAIVRELILAALKAGQEDDDARVDLKLMNTSLKEMRFTAKAFKPYRHVRKVTVFGSARVSPEDPFYRLARDLGAALAAAGYMVITGGGPGIMQAAHEGAGPAHSFGVNIRLPFEQKANPVIRNNPKNVTYKYFFNRKVAFLKEAHAVVLFPGGFGTLDEGMETLTLVQTGKREPIPVLLMDLPGGTYWKRATEFIAAELLGRGYVDSHDLDLATQVSDTASAVAFINRFYHRYHSIRFVGERLIVRMRTPLSAESVAQLKSDFADILVPGGDVAASEPLPPEIEDGDHLDLPRLSVDFNRKSYARLHQFIVALNDALPMD